ncbi:50S ribosomal protein L11 methyltransferase [Shimia sp.]|uniref:50S ribosomal protein L11 methyltransferase n=1 Tax=Shimia sp. TaxID=1954381 RepID=UPI003568B2E9
MGNAPEDSPRLGLSDRGRALLAQLRVPCDAAALEKAGLGPALQAALLDQGLLQLQDDTRQPIEYQEAFGGWKSQRGMLVDHARTAGYQKAIHAVVKPGDRVVDVGTGSGVLAMFAAQAGAGEVHGLELTEMADWAERLARANGLGAVKIVKGDAGRFEMAGQADVIIGEYFGMTFFDEWRHYRAFVDVRDRLLRKGGTVVPRAGRFLLSTVDSQKLYRERGYGFYEVPSYGLDFSVVRAAEVAAPRRYILSADSNTLTATETIASFDFLTSDREAFFFTAETEFAYDADGSFHGFLAHFDLDMAPGQTLGTGPRHRETCWHHSYLPLPKRLMRAGEMLRLRSRSFIDADSDAFCLGLTVAGPGETLEGAPEHVFRLE